MELMEVLKYRILKDFPGITDQELQERLSMLEALLGNLKD